jgi:hypothetical protein
LTERGFVIAAVVAGAIAGYRSFRIAAALDTNAEMLSEAVALGVAGIIERRVS